MRGVERRGKEVSASLKIMLSLPITYSFQWISHSIHMCLGWCLDGIEFSLATLVSGAALSLPNIIFSFPFSFLQNSFLLLCHCRIHQSVFAQQYYQSVSCWDYKIYLKKKKRHCEVCLEQSHHLVHGAVHNWGSAFWEVKVAQGMSEEGAEAASTADLAATAFFTLTNHSLHFSTKQQWKEVPWVITKRCL